MAEPMKLHPSQDVPVRDNVLYLLPKQEEKPVKLRKDGTPKKICQNKQKGRKSEVYAFEAEDMRRMLRFFAEKEQWIHYLLMVLGCNMARRVGDTLSLSWLHFFNPKTGELRSDLLEIEEDKTDKIVSCGEKFINDEGFETYCGLKGGNYEQFICGKVCVSKYQTGDKEGAIALAFDSLHGAFPEGNALVAVLLASLRANDTATAEAIKTKLNMISVEGAEGEYLKKMLAMIG